MKTFLRKARLSFLAMTLAWIVVNLVVWIVSCLILLIQMGVAPVPDWRLYALFGLVSGIVILFAWLVFFLPVDLLVPDHSKLRIPGTAGLCGVAGAIANILVGLSIASIWGDLKLEAELIGGLSVYGVLACITGAVAAYTRCRMDIKHRTP
ncbi:MAG: hypothetical protein IPK32_02865 [Verrucomicrobiaceae bacterium]|nr:hypothetical protein [Verrucomicrobiaceae bacterium]